MAARSLRLLAGPAALRLVREQGISPEMIRLIAGASGGAKWLVLRGIDEILIRELLPGLRAPVHLIGSSIGSWRFVCYAQADPLAALERLEEGYIYQHYSERPDQAEITAKCREILLHTLGTGGADEVLASERLRLHVMTARARGPAASERRAVLGAGLAMAALANVAGRRLLAGFFERALFSDVRDVPPFHRASDFPMRIHKLTRANLADVVLASGAIPLVIDGVRNIDGTAGGIFRDGGIIDYHLDLPLSDTEGIALYPHFYDHIVPGWFDKKLGWRRPAREHMDRVILLAPTAEFVESLPGRKIPDRHDFRRYDTRTRERYWRTAVAESRRLGEEFGELLARGRIAERLEPLFPDAPA